MNLSSHFFLEALSTFSYVKVHYWFMSYAMMVQKRFRSDLWPQESYCSHQPAGKRYIIALKHILKEKVLQYSLLLWFLCSARLRLQTQFLPGEIRLQCGSVFHSRPHICFSSPAGFILVVFFFAHRVADCKPVTLSRAVNTAVFHAISASWLLWSDAETLEALALVLYGTLVFCLSAGWSRVCRSSVSSSFPSVSISRASAAAVRVPDRLLG